MTPKAKRYLKLAATSLVTGLLQAAQAVGAAILVSLEDEEKPAPSATPDPRDLN